MGSPINDYKAPSAPAAENSERDFLETYMLLPDIRLFLILVLAEVPEMTKERLAFILNTRLETIDAILAGQDTKMRSHWFDIFPTLVQRMDFFAVTDKLRSLCAYIERESRDARRGQDRLLYFSLRRYLEQKEGILGGELLGTNPRRGPIPYLQMFFRNADGRRDVRYFQAADFVGKDMDAFVEWHINELRRDGRDFDELLIVLDDDSIYNSFVEKVQEHINKLDQTSSRMTYIANRDYHDITAMLVDQESFDVLEEKSFRALD